MQLARRIWPTLTHALIGTACLAGCHGREPLAVNVHDPLRANDREVSVPDASTDEPDAARVRPSRTPTTPTTSTTPTTPTKTPPTTPTAGSGAAGSRATMRPAIDFAGSGGAPGVRDAGTVPPPWSSTCGNGVIEGGENCEPQDLNGFTCPALGYQGGGVLQCSSTCLFDVSGCRLQPIGEQPTDAGQPTPDDDAGVAQP